MTDLRKKIKILIVDDIPEARENLKKLLQFEPDFDVIATASTGREGLDLARDLVPNIVLMDINMPDMDGIAAANELRRSMPAMAVIMMSVQGEAEYIRRAMAAGAKDFLTKPTPAEELYATVRRVYEIQEQTFRNITINTDEGAGKKSLAADGRETHVIVVYSPQGGAGKTTVATNMAAALMREGTKVLLVDCDLQFGDVSIFLNLKPQATIVDLIKNVDDLDMDLVENVLVTHDSGLRVLCAPHRPADADLVPKDRIPTLIEKLKGRFDYIVVDIPTALDDLALALFDMAARIMLVVNPTLPAVRNTLAVMELLDSFEYPQEKTVFVINRYTADLEKAGITLKIAAIESKMRRQALTIIPMDEKRVLYSVNRGVSVIARDRNQSPAKELVALADTLRTNLSPQLEEQDQTSANQAPKSRFGRLFGG
ncbi:MAG: response regulator [Anaerolinea sp.]|nr:response regulator [Anaerolinea sp.]MCC6976347.1 response regulator [Anaerolineae bacterium]CAG1008016.1 Transcriptional regulatory protein DegU [Anaerolineae bacterium]